jgi:nucleoside-diphosphate-sugar epimerase
MSRVLITGATGAIGTALTRRLLGDPQYEVRISDERPAPQWMRESCEIHHGDLRLAAQARAALDGCSQVVHLGSAEHASLTLDRLAYRSIEHDSTLALRMIDAALELDLERFLLASSGRVFERAETFPTPEEYLPQCLLARSPAGFAALFAERAARAAQAERGLRLTICRPFDVYGASAPPNDGAASEGATEIDRLLVELARSASAGRPAGGQAELELLAAGGQIRTPTHVSDIADGLALALGSSHAIGEDFNLAGSEELSLQEIARIAWSGVGAKARVPVLSGASASVAGPQRSSPAVEKAERLLGWQARIQAGEGIAASARRAFQGL